MSTLNSHNISQQSQEKNKSDYLSHKIFFKKLNKKSINRDFPGGPVVKNLPSNAGDTGSIPGRGAKIPRAAGQLSLCLRSATKSPNDTIKTWGSPVNK